MCGSLNETKNVVSELQGERGKSVKDRTICVNSVFIIFFIFTLSFRFNWFPFLLLSQCQFAMHIYIYIYIYMCVCVCVCVYVCVCKVECYLQNENTAARGAEINSKVLTVPARSMKIISRVL